MLIRFYLLASSKSESRSIKLIRKKIHHSATICALVCYSTSNHMLWCVIAHAIICNVAYAPHAHTVIDRRCVLAYAFICYIHANHMREIEREFIRNETLEWILAAHAEKRTRSLCLGVPKHRIKLKP